MKIPPPTTTKSQYGVAGWAAIASGVIGLLAFAALITAVTTRESLVMSGPVRLLFRSHDVGVIVQFVLLIPVAFSLHGFSQQGSPGMSRRMLNTGIASLSFTVLFLALVFPGVLSDTLYMFPQGVFGVWLMAVNRQMSNQLARGLRWFGLIVGFGLMLVGTFPLGYSILVDPVILRIPAADLASYPETLNVANKILHVILDVGSLLGVITLPIWSILIGRRLLREKNT